MISAEISGMVERITALGEQAAAGTSIEILETQVKGGGKARLLRVYIDKPGGVTHCDCELISERLGKLLDDADIMPEGSYTLEVSSPGVERKLTTRRDFERVVGQKLKLLLAEPMAGETRIEGRLEEVSSESLAVERADGERLRIPLEQVRKANLRFEW